MRSQLSTIMAPEDEASFLAFVFETPTVYVIPEVRNPTPEVPRTRDLSNVESHVCALWDRKILTQPEVEYIPSCNDYYLRSDESLIQFLRSHTTSHSIDAGGIALATAWKGAPETNPKTAQAMTVWFNSLVRWLKRNFVNTFVYASDIKPEIGSRKRDVWVGPHAIKASQSGVSLKLLGPTDFSLRYFDPKDEELTLSRYRSQRRILCLGRVTHVGENTNANTGRQMFHVVLDAGPPFLEVEGAFSCGRPLPRVGDQVACVFSENISGKVTGDWEPREIKKLTAANKERVVQSLRKAGNVSRPRLTVALRGNFVRNTDILSSQRTSCPQCGQAANG